MKVDSRKYEGMLKEAPLVIFDLDGTLYDIVVDWKELKKRVYKLLRDSGSREPSSLREAYLISAENDELKERILAVQSRMEGADLDKAVPVRKGQAVLAWRKSRSMKNALFTSNTRRTAESLLDTEDFTAVVSVDDVALPKPSPDGLNRILERSGISPRDAILLGNSHYDSGSADAAGVRFIDVSSVKTGWFK